MHFNVAVNWLAKTVWPEIFGLLRFPCSIWGSGVILV